MENEIITRQELFGELHQTSEAQEVVQAFVKIGEILDALTMGDGTAKSVMSEVYRRVFGTESDLNDWREAWEAIYGSAEYEFKCAEFFLSLKAFGTFGLCPDLKYNGFVEGDLETRVNAFVSHARKIYDLLPSGWGKSDIEIALLAAEARLNLDRNEGISPAQLAAIADISLKSVKNRLADKTSPEIELGDDGTISSANALRWLSTRPDFYSSIWHTQDPDSPVPKSAETHAEFEVVVFVPVARDGTFFHPKDCRTANGYTIGPKGDEQQVDDYLEALDLLSKMPVPKWRRPNASGMRGIVSGISWERKDLRVLEQELG